MLSEFSARAFDWFQGLPPVAAQRKLSTRNWIAGALPARRVKGHRAELLRVSARLDRQFARGASALEALSEGSASLLGTSRRLLQYSLGQDDTPSTFGAAIQVIERPLRFNDDCLPITRKVEDSLSGVAARISTFHQFRSTLNVAIAPLQILQTMFRIESAAACPETQALFVSLSSEIERLMERMSTMIAREFDAIEQAGSAVSDVIGRLRELRVRQSLASERATQITASVKRLEDEIEANRARDIQLVGATERIASRVANIVACLQYQDILTQRLSHVVSGLDDLAARLDRSESCGELQSMKFLRDVALVEARQLDDIEKILDQAIGSIVQTLGDLSNEIGGLSNECVLLNGVESSSGACDGMVQMLLETFDENLLLIQTTSEQSDTICAVLDPIRSLLGSLTGNILDLSAQIRLIALNAQVQAVQAGAGTGLEVLSDHTRSIAEEMARIVASLATELDGLKEGLKIGMDHAALGRDRSRQFLVYLRAEAEVQEGKLHEFRNRMLAELRFVGEQINKVQNDSLSMAAALDIRPSTVEAIRSLREELEWFSGELQMRLPKCGHAEDLAALAARYTTAAERTSHERALDGSANAAEATSSPEGSVELF
jgi:hypothetical protein